MTLTEIRRVLSDGEIQLTRSLGQNFLHDGNQLRRIVTSAELSGTDKVLEVGPGLGPLTELLLDRAGHVLAIEKDQRLIKFLQERFGGMSRLTLLHADALEHLRKPGDWGEWKLVSNLPYSIASPLLVDIAQAKDGPQLIVATLQLEVARRIVAVADNADYGLLTLLLQLHYEPEGQFKIPASCFFPQPDVDSSCVKLRRRAQPLLSPEQVMVFRRLVRRAFSQRRKMMLKLLKQDWSGQLLESAFADLGLSTKLRAEAVSLEQFVGLTERLAPPSTQ
jgi:16S rRNA (adenine1518-N6/adenine1519-N6)-dimethyltransferase